MSKYWAIKGPDGKWLGKDPVLSEEWKAKRIVSNFPPGEARDYTVKPVAVVPLAVIEDAVEKATMIKRVLDKVDGFGGINRAEMYMLVDCIDKLTEAVVIDETQA